MSTIRKDNLVQNGAKHERRWSALALVVTAQFMVILDVAIVNVALPSIKTDLHFSTTNLQWVISAYAILFGGALLLGGRLADLLGRRRLFVIGLALFSAASLLCGLAWSEGSLIAFRGVQGLGGALFEAIHFENGRILNPHLAEYRVPRFSDVPEIEVVLIDRKDQPSMGAGETPLTGIAPAVANAMFSAVGIRLRSLPLVPQGLPTRAA